MEKNKSDIIKGLNAKNETVEIHVRKPTVAEKDRAKAAYNIALKKALDSGAMFKAKLDKYLRDQNIWDDEKDKKLHDIWATIEAGTKALAKGGIKLSQARETAIAISKARREYLVLMSEYNKIEANTAESQARDAEFNTLVSTCTVYNDTGNPYYSSLSEYLADESDLAYKAANALASLLYDSGGSDKELPENKFLLKYKLVDDELRLINKDGKFVDEFGSLVNEFGQRINENNEPIDKDGNVIVKEEATFAPFLDDDGNPVE